MLLDTDTNVKTNNKILILGLGKTVEEIASSLTHGDINKKTIIQFIYRDYSFMGILNPSIEAHQNGKREDKDITEVRHDAGCSGKKNKVIRL